VPPPQDEAGGEAGEQVDREAERADHDRHGPLTPAHQVAEERDVEQPGDRQQTRAIVDRLGQVLREIGIAPDAARDTRGASVFMIHRWTDEVGDVSSLMLDAITSVRAEVARLDLLPA